MTNKQTPLIDTHCHIDLFENPQQVIVETEAHQIYTFAVTNTPSVYPYTETLCKNLHYVHPAVGLHPELAVSRNHELSQMWEFLKRTRYIGEIGLDYTTKDNSQRQLQVKVFEQILNHCADYRNKILTIHSRRATADVISVIGKDYPGKIILHWYSGTIRELERAVSYGFYFSVNSAMVKSKKGQSLIAKMPDDRVLTETDGPFINISGQPAKPEHIPQIVVKLAELWSVSLDKAEKRILHNFQALHN